MSVSWILSQEKWQGSHEEQKGCSIFHTTSTIRLVLHIFNATCSNHSVSTRFKMKHMSEESDLQVSKCLTHPKVQCIRTESSEQAHLHERRHDISRCNSDLSREKKMWYGTASYQKSCEFVESSDLWWKGWRSVLYLVDPECREHSWCLVKFQYQDFLEKDPKKCCRSPLKTYLLCNHIYKMNHSSCRAHFQLIIP